MFQSNSSHPAASQIYTEPYHRRVRQTRDPQPIAPAILPKEVVMTTPQHCPGFQQFKNLKAFKCKCPECGQELEIFSDEFDKEHACPGCKKKVDFTQCTLDAGS
jgi:hypothetical protein